MIDGIITIKNAWGAKKGAAEDITVKYEYDPASDSFFLRDPTNLYFEPTLSALSKIQEDKIRDLIYRDLESYAAGSSYEKSRI